MMNWGSKELWTRIALWVGAMILFSIALRLIMSWTLLGMILGLSIIIGAVLIFLNRDSIKYSFEQMRNRNNAPKPTRISPRQQREIIKNTPLEQTRPLNSYEKDAWEKLVENLGEDDEKK